MRQGRTHATGASKGIGRAATVELAGRCRRAGDTAWDSHLDGLDVAERRVVPPPVPSLTTTLSCLRSPVANVPAQAAMAGRPVLLGDDLVTRPTLAGKKFEVSAGHLDRHDPSVPSRR
jgi:hypothetical protein